MAKHPSLTIYKNEVIQFINTDFEIEVLDESCAFSEGPVWNEEGFYLFSDIPRNTVYLIAENQPKQTYITASGCAGLDTSFLSEQIGSNGLAYNKNGQLLLCQHGNGAIGSYDGKKIKPLISSYEGRRFNSPNDIVVHSNGTIFFSDPPYGLKDQKLMPQQFQPVAGVYAFRDDKTLLIEKGLQYPNGVCLSPDQKWLYCCSNKSFEKTVLQYDALTWQFKQVVAAENGDGIKCDQFDNLYLCSREGILIIGQKGERLAAIDCNTVPANASWGGSTGHDLLVTARNYILLIKGLQKS